MENKDNNDKTSLFKNNDKFCDFFNNKILYKLSGENVWYLLDYDGNTIVRTRPDGVEEFSLVDFYDMEGEPISVEFSGFNEGFMVSKFLCEKEGEQSVQIYEISPSGFTFKQQYPDKYQRLGLDYRFRKWLTSNDFLHIHVSGFKSKERLDFLYDIAKSKLMKGYEETVKNRPRRGTYKQRESVYFTAAKQMTRRYFEILEYIKKQQIKKENKQQEKLKQLN